MVVVDEVLYFVSSTTIMVYDVSDPRSPVLVGSENIGVGTRHLDYADGFLYLATGRFGLRVVDVRDPTNPEQIAILDLPGEASDVTIKGTTAYAGYAAGPRGVAAVDVRDPFNPIVRGTVDLPSGTHSIALADNNAILVSTISGVTHFVDITPCDLCPADLTGSSDPNDDSYGIPDDDADSDDFFFYLDTFATGDMTICDMDDDADCDAEDFFAYLDLFAAGC